MQAVVELEPTSDNKTYYLAIDGWSMSDNKGTELNVMLFNETWSLTKTYNNIKFFILFYFI